MSSQKSIRSYFKTTPAKRPALTDDNSSPSKRMRSIATEPTTADTADAGDEKQEVALTEKQDKGHESGSVVTNKKLDDEIRKQAVVTPALSENMGHSWFVALRPEFSKKYFVSLSAFLDQERRTNTVFPPVEQVFTWTRHCDIRDVKVVILGQDPYHGPNQAHGLSFSVCKGVEKPPSLRNMFKELQTDVKGFRAPSHGDLTGWAKQGVLLLNAVLTVRAHSANSHSNRGWEHLTDAVIKWLNHNSDHVVFLLWGAYAQVSP